MSLLTAGMFFDAYFASSRRFYTRRDRLFALNPGLRALGTFSRFDGD